MVGSDQVPPERLQRALVEAAVEQFRDRTTTIGLSPSVPASCFARLGEKNQKQEQPRNEAQLHFVSLRSQFHYGARGELSRVEMNALRAPLTALPVPKGICRLFLLDGADALIDGRLCRLYVEVSHAHAGRSSKPALEDYPRSTVVKTDGLGRRDRLLLAAARGNPTS